MSGLRGSMRINDHVGGGMCHSVWLCVRRCNHPVQRGTYDRSIDESTLSNGQNGFNKRKSSDIFFHSLNLSGYIIARHETAAASRLRTPPQQPHYLGLGCGNQVA
jgi:hypothetical protein